MTIAKNGESLLKSYKTRDSKKKKEKKAQKIKLSGV